MVEDFRLRRESIFKMDVNNVVKLHSLQRFVTLESDQSEWWNKLKEPVPAHLMCKKANCSFAPEGHKKHAPVERNYAVFESRLIIQYLIHYDMISFGKGLSVWETMNSRGYLTHRTPLSLNNFFKRTLLKDIKHYKLPKELEVKFTVLRPN